MQSISDLSFSAKSNVHPEVAGALRDCRRALWSVVIFSGAVNLLMLAGPLYMLQVYDRVLSSQSVPTLIALSIMLTTAYAFQGAFDLIRSRIVVRAARLIDDRLGATVHTAMLQIALQSRRAGIAQQPVRDMDQIRSFLTGSGPIAIVDLPWIPVYLVICFLIHPALGLLSLLGGACLFAITLATEWKTKVACAPPDAKLRNALCGNGSRLPQQRNRPRHGDGRYPGRPMETCERELSRGNRTDHGYNERVWQLVENSSNVSSVGHLGPRRLFCDPGRNECRRYNRSIDYDGPCLGAG